MKALPALAAACLLAACNSQQPAATDMAAETSAPPLAVSPSVVGNSPEVSKETLPASHRPIVLLAALGRKLEHPIELGKLDELLHADRSIRSLAWQFGPPDDELGLLLEVDARSGIIPVSVTFKIASGGRATVVAMRTAGEDQPAEQVAATLSGWADAIREQRASQPHP